MTAGYGFRLLHKQCSTLISRVISGAAAEILMILGYFVFEGMMYGFLPSAVNIPANGVQGIAGLIVGIVLIRTIEKSKIMTR